MKYCKNTKGQQRLNHTNLQREEHTTHTPSGWRLLEMSVTDSQMQCLATLHLFLAVQPINSDQKYTSEKYLDLWEKFFLHDVVRFRTNQKLSSCTQTFLFSMLVRRNERMD